MPAAAAARSALVTFRLLYLIFVRLCGWLVLPPRSDDAKGQVTPGLAPLEALAKQDLVARGLTIAGKIPIVHATFALFPSKNLVKAQTAYRLINDLKIVLPIVTLMQEDRSHHGRVTDG